MHARLYAVSRRRQMCKWVILIFNEIGTGLPKIDVLNRKSGNEECANEIPLYCIFTFLHFHGKSNFEQNWQNNRRVPYSLFSPYLFLNSLSPSVRQQTSEHHENHLYLSELFSFHFFLSSAINKIDVSQMCVKNVVLQ